MQLDDKTGIGCDNCGMAYRDDFIYYSFDLKRFQVIASRRPNLESLHHMPTSESFDICTTCFDAMSKSIVAHNMLPANKKALLYSYCELDNAKFGTDYVAYYCVVDLAKVQLKASHCSACKVTVPDGKTCPKCKKGDKIVKQATVHVTNRVLEFTIGAAAHDRLAQNAKQTKLKSEWTAKS